MGQSGCVDDTDLTIEATGIRPEGDVNNRENRALRSNRGKKLRCAQRGPLG